MNTTYSCIIYFLSWSFLAVTHFVILCSGYRFAEVIRLNCKEVVDLRFVHPNAAQLPDIFFSKSTDTKLVYSYIYWWELCSLAVHYFPHVFLSAYFCFACQICAHAQFSGKTKTNPSSLRREFQGVVLRGKKLLT